MTLELGVLCSGSGTNLQAIIDAVEAGTLDARIRLVLSNRPDARAIDRARAHKVPVVIVSHGDHPDREGFDRAMTARLVEHGVEWVVLAGFMRVVTKVLLGAFPLRVINIHPSLLPAFPGVDAQAQALAHGVKVAGCSVHFVDEGVDSGPIIGQRAVPVRDDDTRDSLAGRILHEEHALLVDALRAIARGELRVVSNVAGSGRMRVTGFATDGSTP